MLQTVSNQTPTSWATQVVAASVKKNEMERHFFNGRQAEPRTSLGRDVALLYQQSVVVSSDELSWQDIRLIHLRHEPDELYLPPSDQHCIVLNLGTPLFLRARHQKRTIEGQVLAGESAILPAGTAWTGQYQGSHTHNTLLLYLSPLFVRNAMNELGAIDASLSLAPQVGYRCEHIRHIAMSLLNELNEASVLGRFYAQSLATALAMQIVRRYSSLNDVHVGGGMAPFRLRKAVSLIDRHVADEEEGRIALRDIAKDVGLSYFHFSRAFKQSMGMTPTNYIAERRIERAKELMQETDLPISEIALRAGFSSQSHFTTSFRRFAGVTPRSFRHGI
jgi:AraC family transcriptional regulator